MSDGIHSGPVPLPPHRTTPLGAYLRQWREARHRSQTCVAKAWGVHHSMVSRVESGTRDLHPDQAPVLAKLFGIPEWEVALMICGYDPKTVKADLRREVLHTVISESERLVFAMDRQDAGRTAAIDQEAEAA